MSQIVCPKCHARLAYQGTTGGVKPCPKCGTPIAFVVAASPSPASDVVDAEIVAPVPPKPQPAPYGKSPPRFTAGTPSPPRKSKALWIALGVGGVAVSGLAALIVVGAAIAAFTSRSETSTIDYANEKQASTDASYGSTAGFYPESGYEAAKSAEPAYDASAYAPPAYETPAAYSPPAYDATGGYATPAYDASAAYGTTANYAPAEAPATDSGAPGTYNNLWDFSVPGSRLDELQAAIAQDEARLKELDGQILLFGASDEISVVGEKNAPTENKRTVIGLLGGAARLGKEYLQTERARVQTNLDANRAEVIRLQSGS